MRDQSHVEFLITALCLTFENSSYNMYPVSDVDRINVNGTLSSLELVMLKKSQDNKILSVSVYIINSTQLSLCLMETMLKIVIKIYEFKL